MKKAAPPGSYVCHSDACICATASRQLRSKRIKKTAKLRSYRVLSTVKRHAAAQCNGRARAGRTTASAQYRGISQNGMLSLAPSDCGHDPNEPPAATCWRRVRITIGDDI